MARKRNRGKKTAASGPAKAQPAAKPSPPASGVAKQQETTVSHIQEHIVLEQQKHIPVDMTLLQGAAATCPVMGQLQVSCNITFVLVVRSLIYTMIIIQVSYYNPPSPLPNVPVVLRE